MVDLVADRVEILDYHRDKYHASDDQLRLYALALIRSAARQNDLEDVKAILAALDLLLAVAQ